MHIFKSGLVLLAALCAEIVHALPMTYTGSDPNGSFVQANIAAGQFIANAGALSVIDFEGFGLGSYDSALQTGGVTISPPGIDGSFDILRGFGGAFPVSGGQFIANNFLSDVIQFEFSSAISAFGFFMTDLDSEDVTISFIDGTEQNFVIPGLTINGGDAFFGYVSDQSAITRVTLADNGLIVGYDNFYYSSVVPVPSVLWLVSLGLSFLVVSRRRES